jgi:FSR family fosmidomycin resistance protein-like MFS transporter
MAISHPTIAPVVPPMAIRWLALTHFANDFFSGTLGILLAAQAEKLDLSNSQVGIASTAYYALSLGQPLFGWIADHQHKTFLMITGAFWTAVGMVLGGFAPSFGWLVAAVFFAGFGSATFHPVGLASARHFGKEAGKGRSVALFMLGGNSGFAVAPFFVGFILEATGPKGMAFPFLVSLLFVPLILTRLRPSVQGDLVAAEKISRSVQSTRSTKNRWHKAGWMMLVAYLGIALSRGIVDQAIGVYLPTYYEQAGRSLSFAGVATGAVLFFSAIGSYMGSTLSDHIPRLQIIAVSLLFIPPLLLLLLESDGIGIFIFGILLGLALKASLPLLLMMGQEVFPGGASGASGLAFGWMFMSSTIGTFLVGLLSDEIGLKAALQWMAVLPIVGFMLVFLLRGQTKTRPIATPEFLETPEIQALPTIGD